jgi:hypothetical protein
VCLLADFGGFSRIDAHPSSLMKTSILRIDRKVSGGIVPREN